MRFFLAVFLINFSYILNISAYETITHNKMASDAIELSNLDLDSGLLAEIGIDSNTRETIFPSIVPSDSNGSDPNDTIFLPKTSIVRILSGGAVLEDAGSKSIHHFFDPQNGGVGGSAGLPSPDWILESIVSPVEGEEIKVTLANQDFSYKDAREYFYLALTSPDEADRQINFGLMFRSLGHVIHHLQDMAQPQHVRNDDHCDATIDFPSIAFLCFLIGKHNPSYYESYTNARINFLTVSNPGMEIPRFNIARDYWENVSGSDIAGYTSRNFVSDGTNYQGDNEGKLIHHPSFPGPVPLQDVISVSLPDLLVEDPFMTEEARQLLLEHLGCNFNQCFVDFIQNKIADNGIGGTSIINARSSTISIFDEEIRSRNIQITNTFLSTYKTKRIVSLNRYNFESVYPFLLPRAVAYGAGLINHFFRGRISVASAGWLDEKQIAVTIVNNSHNGNALREGRFEIYYESKNGTRMPVPSVSIQGNGLPLAPGESINLIFDYPDDVDETIEQPYMVVFNGLEGAIGREYGLTSARFPQPVTGTVFNFFLESPDCPAKRFVVIIIFEKQPENNGQVVLMGNDSGARFDFRNIPPGDITINNVLWTHNVRLSKGEYEYQVAITPAGFSGKVCDTPSVGPWIAGEKVIPLNPFIDEL